MDSLRNGKTALAVAVLVAVCMLVGTAVYALWYEGEGGSAETFDARTGSGEDASASLGSDGQAGSAQEWMAYTPEDDEQSSSTQTADPAAEEETSVAEADTPQAMRPVPGQASQPDLPSDTEQPGTEDPVFNTFVVSGQVRHSVWGTPLSGVNVGVDTGATTLTDAQGRYTLRGLASSSVIAVAVSGPWLSPEPLTHYVIVFGDSSRVVDFALYGAGEAFGREWLSARDWRYESNIALEVAVTKVAAVSKEFPGLTTQGALAVLYAAQNGSQQERARGELLASWLDLASAQLGFDTPVSVSSTPGGTDALGADPHTALALVRRADSVIAAKDDPDWNRLRRVLTERSLTE